MDLSETFDKQVAGWKQVYNIVVHEVYLNRINSEYSPLYLDRTSPSLTMSRSARRRVVISLAVTEEAS